MLLLYLNHKPLFWIQTHKGFCERQSKFGGCSSYFNGIHRTDLDRQHLKVEVYSRTFSSRWAALLGPGGCLWIGFMMGCHNRNRKCTVCHKNEQIASFVGKKRENESHRDDDTKVKINAMWNHLCCLTKITDTEKVTAQKDMSFCVQVTRGITHLFVQKFHRWRLLAAVRGQLVSELSSAVTKWLRWTKDTWAIPE